MAALHGAAPAGGKAGCLRGGYRRLATIKHSYMPGRPPLNNVLPLRAGQVGGRTHELGHRARRRNRKTSEHSELVGS